VTPELLAVLSEFDADGDGISFEDMAAAAAKWKASQGNLGSFSLEAFPESLRDNLKAFDKDGDGSVGSAELAMAAKMYQDSLRDQKRLKIVVMVLCGVILLLFAGMFALSWTAIELTKEMRAGDGGVMKTPSGDLVAMAAAEEAVPLLDFPTLSMDVLKQAKDISFVNGPEVHYYVVGSIVQKFPTSGAGGIDVHITSTSGKEIVISAARTLSLDGQIVNTEGRRLSGSCARRLEGSPTLRQLSACGGGATLSMSSQSASGGGICSPMDTNADGFISAAESGAPADDLAAADTDNDGKVSLAECNVAYGGAETAPAPPPPPPTFSNGTREGIFNFPLKSTNLASAPKAKFWTVIPGTIEGTSNPDTPPVYGNDLTDPNAVHGAPYPKDGGVVHAGIGGSGGLNDAFAAKFGADGTFQAGWKSNHPGLDLANAVCVLPSGDIIVAGVAASTNGANNRALWKLTYNAAAGTLTQVWMAYSFGDMPTSNGGFEMCEVGASSLIFSGFVGKEDASGYAFKSYGNVDCLDSCSGHIMSIPISELEKSTPPAAGSWKTRDFPAMETAKAARELANGDIAVQFYRFGAGYDLAMVGPDLVTERWIWSTSADTGHEGTDMAVSKDQTEIIVSGHGKGTSENRPGQNVVFDGTYQGFMSAYRVSDGSKVWTKSYGAGGNPLLIFNECWGVTALTDGYILTCGTGIECDPGTCCRTASLKTGTKLANGLYPLEDKCDKGEGDDRPGAVARPPGKWNSMVIKTDKSGNLQWQRVDGTLAADGQSPAIASSAAEFSVSTDKGIFIQTDLDIGFGLLYLEY